MDQIQITATQVNDKTWAIECSICGPVSLTAAGREDHESIRHMQTHEKVAV